MPPSPPYLAEILASDPDALLSEWMGELSRAGLVREDLMRSSELQESCRTFLQLLRDALHEGDVESMRGPSWNGLRDLLASLSRSRAVLGFSPGETASFILSFKRPIFSRIRTAQAGDPERLADETWNATLLLDKLALYTTEIHTKTREEVIQRQQEELLELSTPVVKLWNGVLALPLIGTLDSARTQVVMESLLQRIVETGSEMAIIDITGVPTVDTLTAQHLLKTVTAARLMGVECIISGIRPQIAQTIVHLGVDLSDVITKANLADAFQLALRRQGVLLTEAPQAR